MPAGFEFDPESPTYPELLDIALIAHRGVSKQVSENPDLLSRSPKELILKWLNKNNRALTKQSRERVAAICNWKPGGGRPPKGNN